MTQRFPIGAVLALAVLAAPAAPAQVPPYPMPGWPQHQGQPAQSPWVGPQGVPQQGLPQQMLVPPQADQLGAGGLRSLPLTPGFQPSGRSQFRTGFQGLESALPRYQGFPNPLALAFGAYPAGPGGARGDQAPRLPPPLTMPPRRDRWPTWLGLTADQKDAPRIDTRAILVRTVDRVWFRDLGETAFVPLPFWDKARVLQAGVQLSIREQGQFSLMLHDGGGIVASGPTELTVGALEESHAELQFTRITRLRASAQMRPVRLRLPAGTTVELREGKVSVLADETRARITHHEGGPTRVVGRHGAVELLPTQAADLLLADGALAPIAAALQTEGGVDPRREGRALFADGRGNGGTVSWYGARLTVAPGVTARLDPLAGARFPESAPAQAASRPTSAPAPATQPDRQQ